MAGSPFVHTHFTDRSHISAGVRNLVAGRSFSIWGYRTNTQSVRRAPVMLDNAVFGMGKNVPDGWSGTARPVRPQIFSRIFEEQANRTPSLPALWVGGHTVGYAELDARANRLAHLLVRQGVAPERT